MASSGTARRCRTAAWSGTAAPGGHGVLTGGLPGEVQASPGAQVTGVATDVRGGRATELRPGTRAS